MQQYDVFRTRGDAARIAPWLVALQSDLLGELATVVVAPLRPAAAHGEILRRVQVPVTFDGQDCVASPGQMVSLPRQVLGSHAGSLASARQELLAAIDFLFIGF